MKSQSLEQRVARLEQRMFGLDGLVAGIEGLTVQTAQFRADMERWFSKLLKRPWTVASALESLGQVPPDEIVVRVRIGIPLADHSKNVVTGWSADVASGGERDGKPNS